MIELFFLGANWLADHLGWMFAIIAFLMIIGACCKSGSDEDDDFGFDDLHGDVPELPPLFGRRVDDQVRHGDDFGG